MIKVLMIGNDSSVKGGITTVINQIKNNDWSNKNIKIKFVPTYVDKSNIVKIIFFIMAYIRIVVTIVFNKPDIIHIHMSYKGSFTRAYLIQKLARKFKIKNIIHLHGSEFEKWYNSCSKNMKEKIKKFISSSDTFITLGPKWEKVIKRIEPSVNVYTLNNSISIKDNFTCWNSNEFIIVFLGVLIERKGIFDLIESIKIIKNKNITKKIKFVICGTGASEKEIKKLCNEYKLNDIIEFTGWVDSKDIGKILSKAQLLVLPSYNEGLPMCILEGMSYGLPILSTSVGDISQAVINNKNGFLINSGESQILANKLNDFINMNEEKWNDMSLNSIRIINDKFSEKVYFKKLEEIYLSNYIDKNKG